MKYVSLVSLPLVLWATASQAIPLSYGTATHKTTAWQELADVPAGDEYGVSWSTDGGSTWDRNVDLYVGQSVQFKFSMHKNNVGTHYADHLKAWVDWGQDGTFNSSDEIAYGEHVLTAFEPVLGSWKAPTVPNFSFYSTIYTLTSADVGDLWLRALVTCSESIVAANGGKWNDQWTSKFVGHYDSLLNPTGFYNQGETEEWKLTVHGVPEPTTLSLLGLSLIGMRLARRKAA